MEKQLILFDFDGTLTKCDTLSLFLRHAGARLFWLKLPLLIFYLILYIFRFMSAQKAKEKIIATLFINKSQQQLSKKGKDFATYLFTNKKLFFRYGALKCLHAYKKNSADIYIVSASPSVWIVPIAEQLGIKAICTEFLYENGIFTGKFLGENCNGAEKVRRIKQEIPNLDEYVRIVAYGDSKGDLPMLALAHEKHFKPFRG